MASWHAASTQSLVECQMCHVFMHPNILEDHLASRHTATTIDTDTISKKSDILSSETNVQQTLSCPICNSGISKLWDKFIKHVKKHSRISCGLCSSSITLEGYSQHIDKCRKKLKATEICPTCNVELSTIRKPIKHFQEHIPSFKCPFPKCSSSITFSGYESHLRKHYGKLISEHKLSSTKVGPQPKCFNPKTPKYFHKVGSPLSLFQDTLHNETQCSLCPMMLTDKLDVKSHMYMHILHQCPVCKSSDLNESQFESHLALCLNTQPNPLQCPQCTRKGTTSRSLIRHIHHSHCSNLIKCNGCYNIIPCFTIKNHPLQCLRRIIPKLTRKQKQLLNSQNVTCLICQKQCKKTQISSHFLTHAHFLCPVCTWSTEKANEFALHLTSCLSHLGPSKTSKSTCPACYRNFPKSTFAEHILAEHSHLCPICFTFMSKKEFTFHGLLCTVIYNDSVCATPNQSDFIPAKDTTQDNLFKKTNSNIPSKQTLNNKASLPSSQFSCPFCSSLHTEDLDQIRSHLQSCEKISSNSSLQVINLPDLVGLRIN